MLFTVIATTHGKEDRVSVNMTPPSLFIHSYPPTSTPRVLRLQECTTIPGYSLCDTGARTKGLYAR